MKKLLWLVAVLICLVTIYWYRDPVWAFTYNFLYQSPCDRPIHYRAGTIDPHFNLSTSELAIDAQQAADIWNTTYGKKLFVYDPESAFTISMVYDGRQTLNEQIDQLNSDLKQQNDNLKPEMAEYERRAANYKQRVTQLNQEIQSWNDKGGAPEDVYNRLKNEQSSLQQEADALNNMARKLAISTNQYNSQVKQLDRTVDTYNQALQYKPEEGIYKSDKTGERILIYFYTNKQEFLHTLTHELGHAIGMDHVNNPAAVMFPKTNLITSPEADDLTELARVCQKKSLWVIEGEKLAYLYDLIKQQIQAKLHGS